MNFINCYNYFLLKMNYNVSMSLSLHSIPPRVTCFSRRYSYFKMSFHPKSVTRPVQSLYQIFDDA